jgi:hypothetical protein
VPIRPAPQTIGTARLATTKAIHIGPDMPPIAGSDAVQVTMIDTTAATFRTIRG